MSWVGRRQFPTWPVSPAMPQSLCHWPPAVCLHTVLGPLTCSGTARTATHQVAVANHASPPPHNALRFFVVRCSAVARRIREHLSRFLLDAAQTVDCTIQDIICCPCRLTCMCRQLPCTLVQQTCRHLPVLLPDDLLASSPQKLIARLHPHLHQLTCTFRNVEMMMATIDNAR